MSARSIKVDTRDLLPPPSPIQIKRPRTRHRTASVTNLPFAPDLALQRPQSRRTQLQTPTFTSLQRFYEEVKSRQELLPEPFSNPDTSVTFTESEVTRTRSRALPPLPPQFRRRLSTINTARTLTESEPAQTEELSKQNLDFSENQQSFLHFRSQPQKVESCGDFSSRINWSKFGPLGVHSSRTQVAPTRSASMDTVQASARYLTDLEWRVCHAVNIYIYKNGIENQSPMLVHIPPAMKCGMKRVLEVLNERIKYPVGYAKALYKMDGTKVVHPCELEMYNNYVVASNQDKHFKCVQYGRRRSPLLVLSPLSKHARAMRDQRDRLRCCLMKKSSNDDLGYVCPRASMEVIEGIGCCKPTEIGGFKPEVPPEGTRQDNSIASPGNRSKSKGQGSNKSVGNQGNSRSPSPGPSIKKQALIPEVTQGNLQGVIKKPMDVNVLSDVRLDAVGGPHSGNDPKLGSVTINLRDLRGDENNNLVDAILAMQRNEHKFPAASTAATGKSTGYKQPSTSKVIASALKNQRYSESEFEPDSYEDSELETVADKSRAVVRHEPSSPVDELRHSSSSVSRASLSSEDRLPKEKRGRTYTIRYHSESPSDPNLPHVLPKAQHKSTSTSSLQLRSTSCHHVGVSTSNHDFPSYFDSLIENSLMLTPPPPLRTPWSDRDREVVLLRHRSTLGQSNLLRFQSERDSSYDRQSLSTRGFTPAVTDDELTFDPFLYCETASRILNVNNNYPAPPSPFETKLSSNWLVYRPETQGYSTFDLVEEPIRIEKTIPPPPEFTSPPRRTVQFLTPPTAFVDDNEELCTSRKTVKAQRSKVKVQPVTMRPRPSFPYPVEDFIFKKGMKSPLRQTVTRHVFPRKKTLGSGVKGKPRLRR